MSINRRRIKLSPTQASLLWLVKFDGLGFVISLGLAILKISSVDKVFLFFLICLSLLYYSRAVRGWMPFQHSYVGFHKFSAVPLLAAATTLLICALTRSYYSGSALLIFVVVWTTWIVAVRALFAQRLPPMRTLIIGEPAFAGELRRAPRLKLTSLTTPPDTFHNFDLVIFDSLASYSEDWLQWMLHANLAGVKVISAATIIETVTGQVPTEMLSGRWAPSLLHGHSTYAFWKRAFDLTITLFLLPLILLLGGIVALIVLLDGGQPVLFWQERVGKDGEPFRMAKFRTMLPDAEQEGQAFAANRDPRITRAGTFLRRSRLDEIAQFYNVLLGEMSIIGPRPEQRVFAETFSKEIPLYEIRHHIRPGITGWAQVTHGYTAGVNEASEKLRRDFYYIKNVSMWLDLQIVMRTVGTILNGFGAR